MQILIFISNCMIPLTIFYIVGVGMINKTNVYSDFVNGAEDGIKTVFKIMPTMVGLMVGVGIMSSSGLLSFITTSLGGITGRIGLPAEVVPPIIVKLFSSSAATGLVLDIFKKFGTDSYSGLVTSIMMSSTETIFYTMSVYFMAAGVTKSRWTLSGALIATAAGIIASVVLAGLM